MKPVATAVLARIQAHWEDLRRSEQAVGQAVLADPDSAVRSSIAALAAKAGVSEPSVLRFCRALGWTGFQDFKLALAHELGAGIRYASQNIDHADEPGMLAAKVIDGAIGSLSELRRRLDPVALRHAIDLLVAARRIECYGLGGAGVVAADAQFKFVRLGLAAVAYSDPHLHGVTSALLQHDDVVVAVSNSGCSRDLLDSVRRAQVAGARVIAIGPAASPLARAAEVTLAVADATDGDPYAVIKARIAPMVIVDCLAIGVALRLGPQATGRLAQVPQLLAKRFVAADSA